MGIFWSPLARVYILPKSKWNPEWHGIVLCVVSFSSFLSCQTQLRGPWWYSCEKVALWHNLIDVRFWSGGVSEWVTTHYYYTLCLFIGGYSILIDTNHATLNKSFFFFRSSSHKSCVWNESDMKYIVTTTRFQTFGGSSFFFASEVCP